MDIVRLGNVQLDKMYSIYLIECTVIRYLITAMQECFVTRLFYQNNTFCPVNVSVALTVPSDDISIAEILGHSHVAVGESVLLLALKIASYLYKDDIFTALSYQTLL